MERSLGGIFFRHYVPTHHKLAESGEPKSRIVLIHGFGQESRYYSSLANSLQERGHEVLVPDLVGWGRNMWWALYENHNVRADAYTAQIRKLVCHLGWDKHKITICGCSMGGAAVQMYTAMHGTDPALPDSTHVSRLVLFCSSGRHEPSSASIAITPIGARLLTHMVALCYYLAGLKAKAKTTMQKMYSDFGYAHDHAACTNGRVASFLSLLATPLKLVAKAIRASPLGPIPYPQKGDSEPFHLANPSPVVRTGVSAWLHALFPCVSLHKLPLLLWRWCQTMSTSPLYTLDPSNLKRAALPPAMESILLLHGTQDWLHRYDGLFGALKELETEVGVKEVRQDVKCVAYGDEKDVLTRTFLNDGLEIRVRLLQRWAHIDMAVSLGALGLEDMPGLWCKEDGDKL